MAPDGHMNTEIWEFCTSNSPSACILASLPHKAEPKNITFSSLVWWEDFILYSLFKSAYPYVRWALSRKKRRRSKGNCYHHAQWLPNSRCQKQQFVWLSFLLLPFLTSFSYCLLKLLSALFPLWLKRWREKILTEIETLLPSTVLCGRALLWPWQPVT